MTLAMCYTVVSDAAPAAQRGQIFYNINAMILILGVGAHPLSAYLLSIDPWLCMWIGFTFLILAVLSSLLIPETLVLRQRADTLYDQENGRSRSNSTQSAADQQTKPPVGSDRGMKKFANQAVFLVKRFMNHISNILFSSKLVVWMLVVSSLYAPLKVSVVISTLQYVTNRFDISWSTVSFSSPDELPHMRALKNVAANPFCFRLPIG